ncbi:MAG: polyribonucleotide nucleotidyltransferase [Actinobacteria bacterium]|nr:polyribonucleotide nucleotidyltransferase [Actinomycetota bacterium]
MEHERISEGPYGVEPYGELEAEPEVLLEQPVRDEIENGGKTMIVQAGGIARQADCAVTVQMGETIVMVSVVGTEEPAEGIDFLPLTVDVEERMYAAGKIPGGFIKREGRPSEKAILTARLIDRPLRPSFPKDFHNEIQVICWVISVDKINPPDILALNGAGAALTASSIPFNGPVAAVRIGRVDGTWIINPTYQELDLSDIDLVVAGNRGAILMVEAGAKEITEEDVVHALERAHEEIKKICDFQEEFRKKYIEEFPEKGHKREISVGLSYLEIETKIREMATGKLREALREPEKAARERQEDLIEDEVMEELASVIEGRERYVANVLKKIKKEEVRRMILEENVRADGRHPDEIRSIDVKAHVLPRPHGTGLFTRGQTQVMSVVTLGTAREEQMIDGLGVEESKRYLHHYNFPPFSTGEIAFLRGPKRREIGHGALAERALLPVIPSEEEFPYTIRVVSDVFESNGSTSMASVCGSTIALMDAGVRIKAPVAGIAMGLIKEGDKVVVLTDILGMEDALGDMDFKVAGTVGGITALQMDMKVEGVGPVILRLALDKAKRARLYILDKIGEVLPEPRPTLSKYAPRIWTIKIPVDKIGELIGPKGKTIRGIIDEIGADKVTIDIEDDGTVYIASTDGESAAMAQSMIEAIVKEPQPGERYVGKVTRLMNFGAFVEIAPGKEGLVHISRLAAGRVPSVESVVKVGDTFEVEVTEIDSQGRVNLASVAAVDAARAAGKELEPLRREGARPRGGRPFGERGRPRGPGRGGGG